MELEKLLPESNKSDTCVLVEGPSWGDAEFYGQWLIGASKAHALLQQAKRHDPTFRLEIGSLEIVRGLHFGILATVFVSQFTDKKFNTFTIGFDSWDVIEFVLMAEMGFFALTGERYQMILPAELNMDRVKEAHLRLARTEDDDWIHPEQLVVDIPSALAAKYQNLLGSMSEAQRLADRRALLFLD